MSAELAERIVEMAVVRPGETLVIAFPAMPAEQFQEHAKLIRDALGDEIRTLILGGEMHLYVLRPGEAS